MLLVRDMLRWNDAMDAQVLSQPAGSLKEAEDWLALGSGAILLVAGASRRSAVGACLAAASAPLLYRGVTGRWPTLGHNGISADDTKVALGGGRGIHLRESIRLELPIDAVYQAWRGLEN